MDVEQLVADNAALRLALARVTDERNYWRVKADSYRAAYERQTARLDRLATVTRAIEEVRNG